MIGNYKEMGVIVGMNLVLGLLFFTHAFGQGTKEDYQRAERIGKDIQENMYNLASQIQWADQTHGFLYSRNTSKGKEFFRVDAQKRNRIPAFDHQKMAVELSLASGEKVQANSLPITSLEFRKNEDQLQFNAYGKSWIYEPKTQRVWENKEGNSRKERSSYWGDRSRMTSSLPVGSPDSLWLAFIKNSNVYIRSKSNKNMEIQLSFDGSEGAPYASSLKWSPNSQHLAALKTVPTKNRTLYLLESSPADQLQPTLQTRNYLKPGDALEQQYPALFSISTKKQVITTAEELPDQYNLSPLKWWDDSRGFTFEYNKRGHQNYQVMELDATTGNLRSILEERSKTFIDYSGKKYRYDVNDGKEVIWASERDGWNHLYLYDGLKGEVKNQITQGEWVVRKVIHVDEKDRTILFEGSGKVKNQDPYFIQYYRVNFDGSELTALTSEDANHVAVFSSDFTYFVDTYSRLDQPAKTVLRQSQDGKVIMDLETADISNLLALGWKMPEVFSAKGRDGTTDIWGMIYRPTSFDPSKKYPIIEYIYAGPHSSFVPKNFSGNPSGVAALAELGFIVVQIDGMGTSNRSKAFHDVCYQNLKDAGFLDRIAWMKAAASKYPAMDLDRVGIYGTSAGGQSSAGAVLFHPEFYKVAVSSCGCHDNRMDKIWWNEQWMGKMGDHYAASSNTENAEKLEGKLMLIVGELDDNVDPASTYQFVDALIKAKKDFEFLMIPGMGHSSGGEYGEHKRRDYFVKHLLGVEPPVWEGQKAVF